MLNNLLLGQTAEEKLYVEDVFSTYLYSGNNSTQTITNGIDLAGKGGMVWSKARNALRNPTIVDYNDTNKSLATNGDGGQQSGIGLTFNSNGYTLGNASLNENGHNLVSWTFREAAKFFDVVTWTGNGSNRTISHALGSVPGMIIVKRTDAAADWQVYHRSLANTEYLVLNSTAAKATGATRWNSTTATSTTFSIGTDSTVNASGGSYVAYLFAHDTSADGIVQCGSYTGNGSASGPVIDLGWEPQYLLIKAASTTGNWFTVDNMRGASVGGADAVLLPNTSESEDNASDRVAFSASGFDLTTANVNLNGSGTTYIYLAIRRGPMRTPTDATKVFKPITYGGDGTSNRLIASGFTADMGYLKPRTTNTGTFAEFSSSNAFYLCDRLRGSGRQLQTHATDAEYADGPQNFNFAQQDGVSISVAASVYYNDPARNYIMHLFKRAPGFFDVVCYTGTGSARTVSHNLGVAPELMIVKARGAAYNWTVYAGDATQYLELNLTDGLQTSTNRWNNTAPTASLFSLGTASNVNNSGTNFVAYLFASCPGVSKVGSYTGNGSSQNINCGFTNGARFVLIKRTDSTGSWLVADTARGIVSGNDPSLALNSTAAEVTSLDWLDPYSAGFTVNQESTNNANVNGATYLYLSIA